MRQATQQQHQSAAQMLAQFRRKGVRLWSENGELRFRAPKGALTRAELDSLGSQCSELVSLLRTHANHATMEARGTIDRAPLTFSQLAHWQLGGLHERPSVRQLAAAMRLHGSLDVQLLQHSLIEITGRHDALRTRVCMIDGEPTQVIDRIGHCWLHFENIAYPSDESRDAALHRAIDDCILEPVDVALGPLFGVRLLKLADGEHVIIVAMEHLISDAGSLNIFIRDLFTGYFHLLRGESPSLPEVAIQFPDFAWQQQNSHAAWSARHGRYWEERMRGCDRLRWPTGNPAMLADRAGWGTVPIRLDKSMKKELVEWCRARRTTLVLGVFTAYVALVLRWCGAADGVFRYQTDGRTNRRLEHTIGYFASVLNLRLNLRNGDTFAQLVARITAEYLNAYEHADASYIDAQSPQPPFARNCSFNWVPASSHGNRWLQGVVEERLCIERIPFENPVLRIYAKESEPGLLLYDYDEEISGGVHYPLNRFDDELMARFGRAFFIFLHAMLQRPDAPPGNIPLPE